MLKELEKTREKAKSAAIESGGTYRTVKESDEWVSLIYLKDKLSRERKQDTRIFREIQELVEVYGGSLFYLNPSSAHKSDLPGSTQKQPVLLLQSGWNNNEDKIINTLTRPNFLDKRGALGNPTHYSVTHTDASIGDDRRFDLGSEIRVSSKSKRKRQKAGYDEAFITRYGISKTVNNPNLFGDRLSMTDSKKLRVNRSSKSRHKSSHRLDSKSPSVTRREPSRTNPSRSQSVIKSRHKSRANTKMMDNTPTKLTAASRRPQSKNTNKKKQSKQSKALNKHKIRTNLASNIGNNRSKPSYHDRDNSESLSSSKRSPRPYQELPVADFNVQDEDRKRKMVEHTKEKKRFEEDLQNVLKSPTEPGFYIVGSNVRSEKDQVQVASEVNKILTTNSNLKPGKGPGKVTKAHVATANKSTQTDVVYEELVQFPIVKYPKGHGPASHTNDKESTLSGSTTLNTWPKPTSYSLRTGDHQGSVNRLGTHQQIDEKTDEEESEPEHKRAKTKNKKGQSKASKDSSRSKKANKKPHHRQNDRGDFLSDPSEEQDYSSDPLEVDHLSEIQEKSEQLDRLQNRNTSKPLDNSFNERLDESHPVLLELLEEKDTDNKNPSPQTAPLKKEPPSPQRDNNKSSPNELPRSADLKDADKNPKQNNQQQTPLQSPAIRDRQESKAGSIKAGSISSRVVEKKNEDGAEIVEYRPEVSLIEETGDPDFKPEEHFKNSDTSKQNNIDNNSYLMDEPEEPQASNAQPAGTSKAPEQNLNQPAVQPTTNALREDSQQQDEVSNPQTINKQDLAEQNKQANNQQSATKTHSASLPPPQPTKQEPTYKSLPPTEGNKHPRTFGKSPFSSQNKEPDPTPQPQQKETPPLKENPFMKNQADNNPADASKPPVKQNPFVKKDGPQPTTNPKPQAPTAAPKPSDNPLVKKLDPPKPDPDPQPAATDKPESSVTNLKSLWK